MAGDQIRVVTFDATVTNHDGTRAFIERIQREELPRLIAEIGPLHRHSIEVIAQRDHDGDVRYTVELEPRQSTEEAE